MATTFDFSPVPPASWTNALPDIEKQTATEKSAVNVAILRNLLDAVEPAANLIASTTGTGSQSVVKPIEVYPDEEADA